MEVAQLRATVAAAHSSTTGFHGLPSSTASPPQVPGGGEDSDAADGDVSDPGNLGDGTDIGDGGDVGGDVDGGGEVGGGEGVGDGGGFR